MTASITCPILLMSTVVKFDDDIGGLMTPRNSTNDRISQVIRMIVEEICNKGDIGLADRFFTATYRNHGGLIPDLIRGPEAIKFSVVSARLAFPGLRIDLDNLKVEGQIAEIRWTVLAHPTIGGQLRAELPVVARLTGTMLVRFTSGQVAESWVRWDESRGAAPDYAAPRLSSHRSGGSGDIETYRASAIALPVHKSSAPHRERRRGTGRVESSVTIPTTKTGLMNRYGA